MEIDKASKLKNRVDLKDQFRLNTDKDVYSDAFGNRDEHGDFSNEYVKWLEDKVGEHRAEDDAIEVNLPIKRVKCSCLEWRYNPMSGTEICTKKDKCKLYDKENYDTSIDFKGISDFRNCLLYNCT